MFCCASAPDTNEVAVTSVPEVIYFELHGRAFAARTAFAIGKVDYIDTRLTFPDFLARKQEFPTGQLPVLKVDDVYHSQSQAIFRYAATLAGIAVTDDIEALKVDEIIFLAEDALTAGSGAHLKTEEKVAKFNILFPRIQSVLERLADQSAVTVAHLFTYATVLCLSDPNTAAFFPGCPAGFFQEERFAALRAQLDKVTTHPNLQQYFQAHPNEVVFSN